MNKLIFTGIFLFFFTFGYNQSPEKKTSLNSSLPVIAREMDSLLMKNMMPVWYPRVIDTEFGGYLSDFNYKWEQSNRQQKMIVTQARHVWTCSKMYAYTRDSAYLEYARHGFQFLKDVMWDKNNGGFYTLVTREGKPVSGGFGEKMQKNAYGNAFAIYGLSAYYKESGNTEALELAKQTFKWLEKGSHDAVYGGYFQFLNEDGSPLKKGFHGTPPKDQNSSIHILEALAELYQVWPDELVGKRLNEMLALIRDVIVHDKGYLQLYLSEDLTPLSMRDSSKEYHRKNFHLDHISYGHDVETAYLLMEASEVLKIKDDRKTMEVTKKMVDNALDNGWDKKSAGVYDAGYFYKNEDTVTIILKSKNWWAQAETMNTLLIMSGLYPNDPHQYEKRFREQWQFIKDYLIDWKYGDWYESALDQEPQAKTARKSQVWKCNYHSSRSLINCINRINNL